MSTTDRTATSAIPEPRRLAGLLVLALLGACEGRRGPAGPAGPSGDSGGGGGGGTGGPTRTAYVLDEPVPELRLTVDELGGASGAGGVFLPGDVPSVDFSLTKADGSPWPLAELTAAEAMLSGPSFNYQRVLPAETDLAQRALELGPGRYRFVFSQPIPATYAPPYHDTSSFNANGGELAGRALLDGTYTLGLSLAWDYTLEGRPFRRVGEATRDVLLGTGAGALTPRAVTSQAHCDRCHGELQAHDGRYRKLELCLLCHTSGAEDQNLPDVAGGTPKVTIDSRVLFHRIHSGRSLPSVNGVTSRSSGVRNYGAAPVPLRYVRADGTVRDYSHVGFPAMPERLEPLPRDTGYDALTPEAQAKEDRIRSGPTRCAVCHGDPDGNGPLEAPAQGTLIQVPNRRACGACHDDVNFANAYRANGQSMPPQGNDNGCVQCHDPRFPGDLSPIDGHRSPLDRPESDAGLRLAFEALSEGPGGDGDGRLEPGERVSLTFSLADDQGTPVALNTLSELRFVLAGPTRAFQVLQDVALPTSLVTGAQPWTVVLPERFQLEYLGDSTAGIDAFQSLHAPHRRAPGVPTEVFVRTGTAGGASVLAAPARRHDGFLEVLDASGFEPGDVVVLDDGVSGSEEYLTVRRVEGTRLALATPNRPVGPPELRRDHAAGASVLEVQLTLRSFPQSYTLDAASGTITERQEFGDGNAVLVSYTSDYLLPAEYPRALNGSRERTDLHGAWSGLPLVAGTYTAALSAVRTLDYPFGTSVTRYHSISPGATRSIQVGDAFEPEPFARIADGASCEACHQELSYHGRFAGFDTCILCHGASGTEDLPRSEAPDAPETPGLSVEFRTLLHKIHRGAELSDPTYVVVGPGPGTTPDDFTPHAYDGYATLPAFPGRTLACARCHGEGNTAALLPADRKHPAFPQHPLASWRPACATCHDAEAEIAHVDSNSAPNGAEACSICHALGEFEDALRAHRERLEPR